MLTLVAMALQAASPGVNTPSTPRTTTPSPQAAAPADIVMPTTLAAWKAMSREDRLTYADVTIQGLRRNPVMARCEALDPANLVRAIDAVRAPGELLIMTVAIAAYSVCPSA